MRPKARLKLAAGIIVVSLLYGYLVAEDASVASAIAVGYVALLLTVLVVINIWKKPEPEHE